MKIKCNHCGNEQEYNLRSDNIPKRPKTVCSNPVCAKWIYINKDQLVRSMTNQTKETLTNDQRDDQTIIINPPIEPQIETISEEALTNHETKDQNERPKTKETKTKRPNHIHIPDFNELIQFSKDNYKNEMGEVVDIELEQFLKHTLPRLEHRRIFGEERGGGGWGGATKCTLIVINKLLKSKKEGGT